MVTPRLVLTPVGLDDVDDLLFLLYGDPEVAHWTGPWNRDGRRGVGRKRGGTVGTGRRWQVDGARSVGQIPCGPGWLHPRQLGRRDGARTRLGGARRPHRRGYATELGRAALAWAAEHRPGEPVVAFTEVHNRASRAESCSGSGCCRQAPSGANGLVEGRTGVHPDAPFALYRIPRSGGPAGGEPSQGDLTPRPLWPCWPQRRQLAVQHAPLKSSHGCSRRNGTLTGLTARVCAVISSLRYRSLARSLANSSASST